MITKKGAKVIYVRLKIQEVPNFFAVLKIDIDNYRFFITLHFVKPAP